MRGCKLSRSEFRIKPSARCGYMHTAQRGVRYRYRFDKTAIDGHMNNTDVKPAEPFKMESIMPSWKRTRRDTLAEQGDAIEEEKVIPDLY